MKTTLLRILRTAFSLVAAVVVADDWPTFRHDIARSGVTSEKLATPLAEAWVFKPRHAPSPAWEPPRAVPVEGYLELPRIRFDDAYHVVIAGGALFFGSSSDNKVYCLDAATGRVRWTFFTGGPVRLAPTVAQGRVYFGSDDGRVYCLAAADGSEVWTRRAGPSSQRLLGHGRMISMWPVRTSVMVDHGVAYYGAGIFPAEGVYIEAVRADNGEVIWRNDTGGEAAESRASPQGYLLATSTNLFVPQGRASPTAFSRKDGKKVYESFFGKSIGGTDALLAEDTLITGTEEMIGFDGATRKKMVWFDGQKLVMTPAVAYVATTNELLALSRQKQPELGLAKFNLRNQRQTIAQDVGQAKKDIRKFTDLIARGRQALKELTAKLAALPDGDLKRAELQQEKAETEHSLKADEEQLAASDLKLAAADKRREALEAQLKDADAEMAACVQWRLAVSCCDSMILAGDVVFAGGDGRVIGADAATGKPRWSAAVNGRAKGLAVANGRLFVSTDTGAIYCFAPGAAKKPAVVAEAVTPSPYPKDRLAATCASAAEEIVRESRVTRGFCLVLGCETGQLALELARRTQLQILGVEANPQKAAAARKALDAAGVYGARVTVDTVGSERLPYASYFANLIVSESALIGRMPSWSAREMFRVLKPVGGVCMIGQPGDAGGVAVLQPAALARWFQASDVTGAQIGPASAPWAKLTRGALPGAGQWTHEYANAANTACSDDRFVKCPLGLLWFGDPGPLQMVSRHRRAAAPLSVNGVLFVQGEHAVNAYDAYNGLKLWDRKIPNVVRTAVSSDCSNLAADDRSFYVVTTDRCLQLDAASGAIKATYTVPPASGGKPRNWGYVAVDSGLLVGTSTTTNRTSDVLFAYDTATGRLRWTHTGVSIGHPSISIGNGRVYFADTVPPPGKATAKPAKKPRGQAKTAKADRAKPSPLRQIVALDLATGRPVWRKEMDLTGAVSGMHWDTLGTMYHDGVLMLFGVYTDGHFWKDFFAGMFEQRRVFALAADYGGLLWSKTIPYRVRPLIIGNVLHAEPWAFDLKTGEQRLRLNPITDRPEPWQFARPGHHCGCPAASPNVMFFRSLYVGYYDLVGDYGTMHFGGQRTGCWINFIMANGLAMIPEASSGCMCAFPIMCTTVLAPRDEQRAWAKYSLEGDVTPVKRLSLNLGAPGDRKDDSGNLWLAWPRPSGSLVLKLDAASTAVKGPVDYFAQSTDSVRVGNTSNPWLYTFGARGLQRLEIPLLEPGDGTCRYTVRLGFAELDDVKPGQRVFDVSLQGNQVLKGFDVLTSAGGPRRAIVKEFKGVVVEEKLLIELTPKPQADPKHLPILQTVDIIRETVLAMGFTVPAIELNEKKPGHTAAVRLANLREEGFNGSLRITAPEGFSVTPAVTPVQMTYGGKAQVAVTVAATGKPKPGKHAARMELLRADGTVEAERTAEISYLGPRGRAVVPACEDAYATRRGAGAGSAKALLVDGGNKTMGDDHHAVAYLKFTLDVPGRPVSARLRIWNAGNPTTNGGNICLVTGHWTEETLTYGNRPKPGQVLANLGRLESNQLIEVPLKLPLPAQGGVSLAIDPVNCDGVNYLSREGGKAAELVVEYDL